MVVRALSHQAASSGVGPRAWAHSDVDQPRITNVLLVEDDDGVRETTAAILRDVGYAVVQATDGATALQLLERRDIDVLLLDIRLPHMNGVAVLEALDEAPTVVVISGFESVEELELRRRFGPLLFECLRKPVLPRDLIAVTAAAADSAHSGDSGDRMA